MNRICLLALALSACAVPQVEADVSCEGTQCSVDWTPPQGEQAGVHSLIVSNAEVTLWRLDSVDPDSPVILPGVVLGEVIDGTEVDATYEALVLESGETYELSISRYTEGSADADSPRFAYGALASFTVP